MPIIINPGTEGRAGATEENARILVDRLVAITAPGATIERNASADMKGGFFGFIISKGDVCVEIEAPGDDPDVTDKSIPFESRRLYVDGSSWLFKYAVGITADRFNPEEDHA